MNKITKETTIGDAIKIDTGIIPILMSAGMHCVGCPSSQGETIEEALDGRQLQPLVRSPFQSDTLEKESQEGL